MRREKNNAEIVAVDLKPGDIILTGGFNLDQGRGNIANALVGLITGSHFGHAMLYAGAGMVLQKGGKRSTPLAGALRGIADALVFRPKYLHSRRAHEVVSQADRLSRQGYAFGDALRSLCHHPQAIRFYHKHAGRQLASGQQDHLHHHEPHTLDCAGLIFEAYRDAGFPLGDIDPRFSWPRDFLTAYRRGVLQFVGILKGAEAMTAQTAKNGEKNIFSNLPKSRGLFIAGRKTEAAPPPKSASPPPPRPAPARDPLEDIGPAQAATLKEAAANGTPFCEP